MTIDAIRRLLDAQPFQPFTVHLAYGREIPVHHREMIMALPSGRTLVVGQPDDTVNIVDLLLVADIELKMRRNRSSGRRPRR